MADNGYARYTGLGGSGSGGVTSLGVFDSAASDPRGANLVAGILTLQSATASNPGEVNTSTQTFAGNKTFTGTVSALTLMSPGTGGISGVGQYPYVGSSGIASITMVASSADPRLYFFNGQSLEYYLGFGTTNGIAITNFGAGVKLLEVMDASTVFRPSATGTPYLTASPTVLTATGTLTAANFSGSSSGTNTGDVTLGTANGLSLSSQVLSLGLSSTSTTGALSSTDWNTFNGKQAALTLGNITSTPTTNLVVTGGTGAVIGAGVTLTLTGSSIVESTSSVLTIGGATNAVLGTGVTLQVKQAGTSQSGYLSSTDWNTFNGKGAGTVTNLSVVSANGLAGTVATSTTTPAITLSTTITGILQGNGTAISAASTTGSDAVVLATSPTLVTPALGTPSALVGTNITGTAASLTAGLASNVAGGLGGQVHYQSAANTTAFLANGTAKQLLQSQGGTAALAWKTLTPTKTILTSTGSTAGYFFLTTGSNVTVGATYTDSSSHVFTAIETLTGQQSLFMTGASAPTGTTLTKASGTGDTTITFTQTQTYATYTPPAGVTSLKVTAISGGGGGGGAATAAASQAAASGGGGGSGSISYYTSPAASYPYSVATGGSGGAAGNNNGIIGGLSIFGDLTTGRTFITGGNPGSGSGTTALTSNGVTAFGIASQGPGVTTSGYSVGGGPSGPGIVTAGAAIGGAGGVSAFGFGAAGSNTAGGAGIAGQLYGGGGGGASTYNNSGAAAGGAGAAGIIIIEEFYT